VFTYTYTLNSNEPVLHIYEIKVYVKEPVSGDQLTQSTTYFVVRTHMCTDGRRRKKIEKKNIFVEFSY
jgi:hypothetical protein